MSGFDLVIRGGTLVDGTGGAPFVADIGISGGRIAAIGADLPEGAESIDAAGLLVTPGFVDVHTHYDGHVTWENRLIPSSCHGVTTAIIGNCGVGFAPCKPEGREGLIRLMEGVEDIPFPVLSTGLPWKWESFPEYLAFLAGRSFDMDVAAYVPHAALRVYVMGERGVERELATPDDIARMAALLDEAMDAGVIGIATSRTIFHRSSDGKSIPTLDAGEAELLAFADVLRKKGRGVFQIVEDIHLPEGSLALIRKLAERSGRPVTFSIGTGNTGPYKWPAILDDMADANANGLVIKGQLMPRGIGMILGPELTLNPFYSTPGYVALAGLPLGERLVELRKPEVRAEILSQALDPNAASVLGQMVRGFGTMFQLGDPPDYEQPPENSIAARAAGMGISPEELAYDLMVEGERGGRLYLAMANYADGSLDAVGEMLKHPDVVPGLGDGGAHCGTICDGSYSTFLLAYWGRDRTHGRLSLPDIVRRLSAETAELMGLEDRGVLAPGKRADINIIDFDGLKLHAPEVTYDLPCNEKRLVQRAEGYRATLVNGEIVYRDGAANGPLPGRLIKAA